MVRQTVGVIEYRTPTEIEQMRPAGAFVASVLTALKAKAAVGVNLLELDALVDWGLTDVVARPGKNDRPYTYWDYRAGRFHKDQGMRIDYVLASAAVTVTDAYVDREARKGTGPSDHAPIVVDLTLPNVP